MSNAKRAMRAVPKPVEGNTPRDPAAELEACLEVLADYVDQTPDDDPALYDSEFLTACWQTVELSWTLLREYTELVALMDEFIAEQSKAQQASKLIIAAAGDERKYLK